MPLPALRLRSIARSRNSRPPRPPSRCRLLRRLVRLPLFLAIAATPSPAAEPPSLTTAAAIRALSPASAASGLPVEMTGTVISLQIPARNGMFVENFGQAVWVSTLRLPQKPLVRVGDRVSVRGATDPGGFSPIVIAKEIDVLGPGRMPDPVPLPLQAFPAPEMEARWVEVRGTVKLSRPMQPRDLLGSDAPANEYTAETLRRFSTLILTNGRTDLWVKVGEPLDHAALEDAEVTIRGVCVSQHNTTRQFVRQFITAPLADCIRVDRPPPDAPFALPRVSVGDLFRYQPGVIPPHRVRVRGTVTHAADDTLWIRDAGHGLRVEGDFAATPSPRPGEVVDVLGFPSIRDLTHLLEYARFRPAGRVPPPEPIKLQSRRRASAHISDLVAIEARITSIRPTIDGHSLLLEWDGAPLEVRHPSRAGSLPEAIRPSATIRATGILAVDPQVQPSIAGEWNPRSFRLLARGPEDFAIIEPAPWWTIERLAWALGLATAASLALGAGILLTSRRRLREQALQRTLAEREFSAVLNERNRLAREIHDTLAQGLNAVSMQLELARNLQPQAPERALQHITTARQIVRDALAQARDSIWNMRSQILEHTDLPGAIERVTHQLVEGLPIETRVDVRGQPRRLPPVVENNLLRIAQEAVANAVKHAGASHITITLGFQAGRLDLEIADDGRGFSPGQADPAGSTFGLVGMRERATQIQGTLEIDSRPDGGTRVRVSVETPR